MNFGTTKRISVLIFLNILLVGFALKASEYFSYVNFVGRDFLGMLSNKIQEKIFLTELEKSVTVEQMKFDVLRNDLRIKIVTNEKYLTGSVNTKLLIIDSTDRIILNLDDNLEITKVNGTRGYTNYSHFEDRVEIFFEKVLNPQDSVEISIEYHGHPREIGLAGFDFVAGTNRFYTLSEPNFANTWWPCKDIPSDKFLASIEIIVPEKTIAVSNGKLVSIEQIDTSWISYKYEVTYPIASYLVSICGAEYKEFGNTFNSVSGREIPLKYFVFEDKVIDAKKDFEIIPEMIGVFEKLFGEYPFQNEHYGIVEFDWLFGGMEHQTMTSIGSNYITGLQLHDKLLAHELAHEWFGNSVTLNDWNDIWLNEGFATYSAHLFSEFAGKNNKLNPNRLFYGSLYKPNGFLFGSTVYEKGAWVLHMLRKKVGDDNFFQAIRKYYGTYKFRNSATANLKSVFESTCGSDFSKFFNQWIYSHVEKPVFKISYITFEGENNYICKVILEQKQPREIYENEIAIRLELKNRNVIDTYIFNNSKMQILTFNVSAPVEKLIIDPEGDLLKKAIYKKIN